MNITKKNQFVNFAYTKGPIDIFKEKQVHDYYEIYLLLNGDVEFLNDHIRRRIFPYTLVIIPPKMYHQFLVLNDPNSYERYVLNVNSFLLKESVVSNALHGKEIFSLPTNHRVVENFTYLNESAKLMSEEDFSFLLSAIATDIIFSIKRLHAPPQTNKDKLSPLSLKLMAYINEHYTQTLNLEKLSQTFNFSTSVICHTFKNDFGISIKKYIQQKRMIAIHLDLQNGESPEQMAFKYGFSEYTTFFRAYKKYFGVAPSTTKKIKN